MLDGLETLEIRGLSPHCTNTYPPCPSLIAHKLGDNSIMLIEAPGLWLASAAALLGSLVYGYQLGVLNTPLAAVATDLGVPLATRGAAIVSALLAGGVVGALAAGNVADKVGPKSSILLTDVVLALGCTLSFFSPHSFANLLSARFITGVASGCLSLLVPRYTVETAPPAVRGALGSLSQLCICTGILASYLAGIPYIKASSPAWRNIAWWRWMLLLPTGLAVVQALLLMRCPESPVWLRWRGRHEEACKVVRRLSSAAEGAAQPQEPLIPPATVHGHALCAAAGRHFGQCPASASATRSCEQRLLAPPQAAEQVPWREIFGGRYKQMLLLAIGIPLTQQLSGINTVIYFSADIFAAAGLQSPILGAVLVGVVNIIGTIAATAIVDRGGRRPLMVTSHSFMAAALFAIVLASWLPGVSAATSAQLVFACVLLFVIGFSLGSGPLPFLIMSEVLSSGVKGRVSSISTALNWSANLVVGLSFPTMLGSLGTGGAYLIYALINVACAVFCAFLLVETKQRSMSDIEGMLLGT